MVPKPVAFDKKMKKFFGDTRIFAEKNLRLFQNPQRTKRYVFDVADRGWKECKQLFAQFVFVFKFLDTSCRVDDLFRTCKERMACIADIDAHFRLVGEYGKTVSACTTYVAFDILWMDPFFHNCFLVY